MKSALFLLLVLFLSTSCLNQVNTTINNHLLQNMQRQVPNLQLGTKLNILSKLTDDDDTSDTKMIVLTVDDNNDPQYLAGIDNTGRILYVDNRLNENEGLYESRNLRLWEADRIKDGITFKKNGKYEVVNIIGKGALDIISGGTIFLDCLHNGVTGSRIQVELDIVRTTKENVTVWNLYTNSNTPNVGPNIRIERMHFVIKSIFPIGSVGISEVLFNEEAEDEI